MSSSRLDPSLFRDAMRASGEALPLPKKLSYALLFGADWRYSMLGYAYLRCVDDMVDEEQDEATSLELMAEQRGFMDAAYEGTLEQEDVVAPARYGLPFFAWDRERGAPLRAQFEAFLDTMEFDISRRGRVPSASELDDYVLTTGRAFLRCLAYFSTGKQELPDPCLDLGSRAYLCADALMDLEADLAVGLINIPPEVIEEYAIDLEEPEAGLKRWRPVRAAEVLEVFRQARATIPLIDNLSLRLLYRHYLRRKKRRFLRFLRQRGLDHVIR
ncbi:MAG: squalene/phytoene synthase family protein [Acidobacteria bacterium]|nr:squalene/phytoene synthase family protein [Acidobacteriota bacterium]